ncbi:MULTISPECIES: hypothetical protein [unclassified Dietzia]|uniref:hypothetical protein n=1 Tax=unclassified Dietzia TaxID=2617939 RepID=UPI000D22734C|nr:MULTISPECIES: hypothetical protein [unclassified Dietzia]AVZ38976.1 hypothetical protein CT688_05265 [Dietzia sp. JS16-p6b]QGW24129.1 hypothetical protein GJR88_01697 [Dietzia sp. DQ12-45-1b]
MGYAWKSGTGFRESEPYEVQRPDDLPIASAVWDEVKKVRMVVPTHHSLGIALYRALGDLEFEVIELRRRLADVEERENG